MKDDDRQFIEGLKSAYRPDDMSPSQIEAFNQSLRDELQSGQGKTLFVPWLLAAALILVGAFALSLSAETQPAEESAVELGVVNNERSTTMADPGLNEADLTALGFDSLEEEELDEILQDEWLPDDYQALAMVIDFNHE